MEQASLDTDMQFNSHIKIEEMDFETMSDSAAVVSADMCDSAAGHSADMCDSAAVVSADMCDSAAEQSADMCDSAAVESADMCDSAAGQSADMSDSAAGHSADTSDSAAKQLDSNDYTIMSLADGTQVGLMHPRYKCPMCCFHFYMTSNLTQHAVEVHNVVKCDAEKISVKQEWAWLCMLCNDKYVFNADHRYTKHFQTRHTLHVELKMLVPHTQHNCNSQVKKEFHVKCPHCTSTFAHESDADKHVLEAHGQLKHKKLTTFLCNFCLKCKENVFKLGGKFSQCHCKNTVTTNKVAVEATVQRLRCVFCHQSVKSLKRHIQNMHPELENFKNFTCLVCRTSYSCQDKLTLHKMNCKPYTPCTFNAPIFIFPSVEVSLSCLTTKILVTTFQCPVCSVSFDTEKCCHAHILASHSNANPVCLYLILYYCSPCGILHETLADHKLHVGVGQCVQKFYDIVSNVLSIVAAKFSSLRGLGDSALNSIKSVTITSDTLLVGKASQSLNIPCDMCKLICASAAAYTWHKSSLHNKQLALSFIMELTSREIATGIKKVKNYLNPVEKRKALSPKDQAIMNNFDRCEISVYFCLECCAKFGVKSNFLSHVTECHGLVDNFRYIQQLLSVLCCQQCGFACTSLAQCTEHSSHCKPQTMSKCATFDACVYTSTCCNENFICRNTLLKHKCRFEPKGNIHMKIVRFHKCVDCCAVFNLQYLLRKHIPLCTPQNSKPVFLAESPDLKTWLKDSTIYKVLEFQDMRLCSMYEAPDVSQPIRSFTVTNQEDLYTCPACGQHFCTEQRLLSHARHAHPDTRCFVINNKQRVSCFQCSLCGDLAFSQQQCEDHERCCITQVQYEKHIYFCHSCKIKFATSNEYLKHVLTFHSKKIKEMSPLMNVTYGCFVCHQIFPSLVTLTMHINTCEFAQNIVISDNNASGHTQNIVTFNMSDSENNLEALIDLTSNTQKNSKAISKEDIQKFYCKNCKFCFKSVLSLKVHDKLCSKKSCYMKIKNNKYDRNNTAIMLKQKSVVTDVCKFDVSQHCSPSEVHVNNPDAAVLPCSSSEVHVNTPDVSVLPCSTSKVHVNTSDVSVLACSPSEVHVRTPDAAVSTVFNIAHHYIALRQMKYTCSVCTIQTYWDECQVKDHITFSHPESTEVTLNTEVTCTYQCKICSKLLDTSLQEHSASHEMSSGYCRVARPVHMCVKCDLCFLSVQLCAEHLSSVHANRASMCVKFRDVFACSVCHNKEQFLSQLEFLAHMQCHKIRVDTNFLTPCDVQYKTDIKQAKNNAIQVNGREGTENLTRSALKTQLLSSNSTLKKRSIPTTSHQAKNSHTSSQSDSNVIEASSRFRPIQPSTATSKPSIFKALPKPSPAPIKVKYTKGERLVHHCTKCTAKFLLSNQCVNHLSKIHNITENFPLYSKLQTCCVYQCSMCRDGAFFSMDILTCHMRSHVTQLSEEKPKKKKKAEKAPVPAPAVESDTLHIDERKQFECKKCCALFENSSSLNEHTQHIKQDVYKMDSRQVYYCTLCKKSFPSTPKYCIIHLRRMHNSSGDKLMLKKTEELFACTVCRSGSRRFHLDKSALAQHMKLWHTLVLSMSHNQACPVVLPAFCSMDTDDYVISDRFFCSECSANYVTRNACAAHIKKKHPRAQITTQNLYGCGICSKTFLSTLLLNEHKMKHPINTRAVDKHPAVPSADTRMTSQQPTNDLQTRDEPQTNSKRHIFECGVCHAAFLSPAKCRLHLEREHEQHGNDEVIITTEVTDMSDWSVCEICVDNGKEICYINSASLEEHMHLVHGNTLTEPQLSLKSNSDVSQPSTLRPNLSSCDANIKVDQPTDSTLQFDSVFIKQESVDTNSMHCCEIDIKEEEDTTMHCDNSIDIKDEEIGFNHNELPTDQIHETACGKQEIVSGFVSNCPESSYQTAEEKQELRAADDDMQMLICDNEPHSTLHTPT